MQLTRRTQILYPSARKFYNSVVGVVRKKYDFVDPQGNEQPFSWPPYDEPPGVYEDSSPVTHLGRLLIGYLESLELLRPSSLQQSTGLRRKPRSCAFECTLRFSVQHGKMEMYVVLAMAFGRHSELSAPYITGEELCDYLEELILTGAVSRAHNVAFKFKFETLRLRHITGSINGLQLDF